MKKNQSKKLGSPSELIDARIEDLDDWRGEMLSRVRALIKEALPEVIEEWKWGGTPVWSHNGIICTGETYKTVVKLTFAKGASLKDPSHLFNSSLEGNTRRAIDIHEGEKLDARAFKALVKAAAAHNGAPEKKAKPSARDAKQSPRDAKASAREARPAAHEAKRSTRDAKPVARDAKPSKARKDAKVPLLSGGNPQIAKADGDAPVQAYIAAMPGWKRDVGARLDALITRNARGVRKAVKWNSPFYGIEEQGWFLSFHVFTHYVKVTFFAGASLRPVPPGGTVRSKDARWIDVHEDELDEKQMATWVKQAAALPGWLA